MSFEKQLKEVHLYCDFLEGKIPAESHKTFLNKL